jgi:benzoylformate decarboxylase
MSDKKNTLTVQDATYNLLRKLGLTTIFGNPGSTEQPFLKNFPSDFEYVLGLQEATAVAMADGFAQATGKPALLNLHTSAGTGHGMGNIMTAFLNKTPLIITAGQQTREMILCDPAEVRNAIVDSAVRDYLPSYHIPETRPAKPQGS